MADILILEADARTGRQMQELLVRAGHTCQLTQTAAQAEAYLNEEQRMLTIMSARLPWTDSHPLLRKLSQKGWPVLFVTSDSANREHLQALYAGPSQVVVRPFGPRQLARAAQELWESCREQLCYGSLQLNLTDKQVLLEGRPLSLTAQEFALLEELMKAPETALSREHLLRTAWGYQGMGETRTVDVHVQRLRKKLGCDRIETVYKLGYRLKMA